MQKAFQVTSPASNLRSMNIPDFHLEEKKGQGKTFVLGIVGGANSGKTILAETLKQIFLSENHSVSILKEVSEKIEKFEFLKWIFPGNFVGSFKVF